MPTAPRREGKKALDTPPSTLRLHPTDNVGVAIQTLTAGTQAAPLDVVAIEPIPRGHKLASQPIARGQRVLKYGQVIGVALTDIAAGAHVHVHNLAVSEDRLPAQTPAPSPNNTAARSFMGYRRGDGRYGTRNYVAILTSVNCSGTVARLIAEEAQRSGLLRRFPNVDGIVPIAHASGCGMADRGEGHDLLLRTLWGTAANPNFAAVLLVGLGCEVLQLPKFTRASGLASNPALRSFTIQDAGGTRAAVAQGLAHLADLLPIANGATRSEAPASAITLGLQCGGSDAWSGLTSNPALGAAADRLVALGGTVLLSETPEIYGAEHLLIARAKSADIVEKLNARMAWWRRYAAMHGAEMNNNPSPGNIAGGLTTILEKSLGAVAKSGSSPLVDVIEYAEPVRAQGLVFMDSPGFDPCSATGQIASGATMIAFTTGRGSAFGSKPSPSIKLSSNTDIYDRMRDDIDLDCGPILGGDASIDSKGQEILDLLLACASGQTTKSEALGYGGVEFVPWQIGATM